MICCLRHLWIAGILGSLPGTWAMGAAPLASGWGVDGLLSCAVPAGTEEEYLALLKKESAISLVRERGTGSNDPAAGQERIRTSYRTENLAGLRVIAFAQDIRVPGTGAGFLPVDLRAVFFEGVRLGRDYAGVVSAWELPNEPELGWWPDMPDRYASHAKALYLGLKTGAREAGKDTPVLLGALGLPAGPWLERVARNGALSYGDAWNVHYYGEATQFSGFLDGNLAAMKELMAESGIIGPAAGGLWPVRNGRPARWPVPLAKFPVLPVWVTEVGLKTVTTETWADPGRRARQAEFIISTARQALGRPEVAGFMPFVLIHENDPYALIEGADKTWPAWDAYAEFTRQNPWPERPAFRTAKEPNPIVLQWLADPDTSSGHKVAGAYRWKSAGDPLRGELRIYNLGSAPVTGYLKAWRGRERAIHAQAGALTRTEPPSHERLRVPPKGMLSLPLAFLLPEDPDGGREWREYTFEEPDGRSSVLGFAVERSPDIYPPEWQPLEFGSWEDSGPDWRYLPHAEDGGGLGSWRAINGVRVLWAKRALARFEVGTGPWATTDPEFPPMAAARLPRGLPPGGWLRVAARDLGPVPVPFRVDLRDEEGHRFTIWENLGQVRGARSDAVRWMALEDFHPYAWGKLDGQRRLRPERVREVQLRFYPSRGPAMTDVELGFGSALGRVPVDAGANENNGAAIEPYSKVP